MKKAFIMLMSLVAMMAASTSLKAQEVAIELVPGWNWIAYPYAETVDLNTALGSFTPAVGDMIKSQFGNSTYSYGRWRGAVQSLNAGEGYHYFSSRTEPVVLVFGLPSIPMGTLTVTTSEPTNITSTTATCGGSAVSNDSTSILMKGVCWATHPQPTTNDSYTEDGNGSGDFTSEISELDPETVYYVRAYAVSVKGINYGEELSFTTAPQGVLNGLFSVSENTQVCFSQGNLQYQASTNTWRFAEHQWDFVGDESHGNVYEDDEKCNNNLVSSTYNGWIDLFGWGTSDHEHGANCYQPWSANTSVEDYYAYGVETNNLFDQNGQADWGCNSISNGGNVGNSWRTLTSGEWIYLFNTRNTASGIRWTQGNVNGVNGVIVLPDDWDVSNYSLNDANGGNFDSNTISEEDWTNLFEANGAVFLPAALQRIGTTVSNESDSNYGVYWSSSRCNTENAYAVHLYYGGINPWDNWLRCVGRSVRLVRPAQANTSYSIEAVPNPTGGGTITGAGTYDYYSQVTLTATANESYTFYQWKENGNMVSTENPYSFVAFFDRNLEAVFLESSTYPLLYSYNEGDHTATVIGRWDGVELTGELVIPETVMHNGETYTVTAIGDNAFNGCSNLTSVEFPSSLVSIGGYAFSGCSSLTSIEFPNSLESIGDWAFRYCNGFTSVFIPASVTQIGVNPFTECSNISQITVESGNAYYDSRDNCNAIIETNSNKLISGCLNTIVPSAVTSLGQDAFYIESLTSVTILAETPPTLGTCSFCGVDKSIPVYVPCASIEAYQIASGWSEFTNFIGVGQCSGMVTVTASPEEYGTVTGGGYYENSATCTVTATPNEGYYFLCWKEDGQGVSTEATYTFPVYRDHNLTAIFYATLGDENIINGDFEQGNVGFTSEYYYNYDIGQGGYYVDDNPHGWEGFGHGGSGNFMLIDAATEPGINVWTEQIPVELNTYYVFSTWVCTLYPESMASLQFSINGTPIGVCTAPLQTNTWKQFITTWYSGDSTTATITIVDLNTEGSGNDFGLDDISFREMDPVQGGIPIGAVNGKFTINADGGQIYFSQGNLQYQASTNTWRFAENQWDYVGNDTLGTVYENGIKCDNSLISSTYDGWIDLFGWGTSCYDHGAVCYQPWSISSNGYDYSAYGNYNSSLCDQTGQADWGYNLISNGGNQENSGWKTLMSGEWDYVLHNRSTSSGIRYAKAIVNDINGVILLPDDWDANVFILNSPNDDGNFNINVLTALEWTVLENAGAVFLPAAGYRSGTSVNIENVRYWSASCLYDCGYTMYFFNGWNPLNNSNRFEKYFGHSVRLVYPVE